MATLTRAMGTSSFGSAGERRQQSQRKASTGTELASLRTAPVGAEPVAAWRTNPAKAFKDPYFVGLRQGHHKNDLEASILRQLETFILKLGQGLCGGY